MIFTLGTYIVELEQPAQYPLSSSTELVQAMDKSASGITHVESFEVESSIATYVFVDMSENDYQAVMDWFINTADGMMVEFDLTDDLGITRTVRFTTAKISFKKNAFSLWGGSFTVEAVQ